MKTCCRCGIEKENIEFGKNSTKKSGLQDNCKVCSREITRQWRLANKERELKYSRAKYQEKKEYYKGKMKERYEENPEYFAEYTKKRRKEKPWENLISNHNRRVKLKQCKPPWVTRKMIREFAKTKPKGNYHWGHIIPIVAMGYIDGKRVQVASGLHVPANWAWQTARDNLTIQDDLERALTWIKKNPGY